MTAAEAGFVIAVAGVVAGSGAWWLAGDINAKQWWLVPVVVAPRCWPQPGQRNG